MTPPAGKQPLELHGARPRWFRAWEALQYAVLALAVLAVLAPILAIAWYVLTRGLPAFWSPAGPGDGTGRFSLDFLTLPPVDKMSAGGISLPLVGTGWLLLGTFFFALPLGVLGAVYITEYGRGGRFTRILRLAIVNLAGVPSVVYGLFGLGFFVYVVGGSIDRAFFAQQLPRPTFGTGGLLWACLTLALLVLPVVITATEEALLSVPDSLREASQALGCTRWQTVWTVVLPNALPGILTGMILGLSRAAGETAPILLTGAAYYLATLPEGPHSQFMALPYHLYSVATQTEHVPERVQRGTALVLLGVVLGLNGIASLFRARARSLRRW